MLNTFTKKLILTTAIAGTAGLIALGSASPSYAQDSAFSDAQKSEINSMIEQYLLDNPSVIYKSIDAHRANEAKLQEEQAASAIKDNIAKLTSKDSPSIGPDDADVTIVEFFDYNCGYCKRALPDVQAIAASDKKVRFVF